MKQLTVMAVFAATILLAGSFGLMPAALAMHKPVKILIQVRDASTGKPVRGVECTTDPAGGPSPATTNHGGVARILLLAGTSFVDLTCGSATLDGVKLKTHGTTVVRVMV